MDEVPPMPSTGLGKYSFRRKKTQPEIKKEVNLATALPSTDDFRTSLLLPNLSARFSMLREQDDPNTKVGKASDDSVLFPKRVSRLNLFAIGDLADISEVASLSGSIKPPFAAERSSTYSAGDASYTTDEEGRNVMTRSRPGQGNRFFGGRQKVYVLSTRDGETSMSKSKGRAVYDDDINIPSYKASFDQQRPSEDTDRDSNTGYNSKRETSSSTNSGPFESRMSTAATSVASTAPSPAIANAGFGNKFGSFSSADRLAKGKRLYGQGLEQQIYEQQSSALNRLNSIQRNGGSGTNQYGGIPLVSRSGSLPSTLPTQPIRTPSTGSTVAAESLKNATGGFDFGIAQNAAQETSSKPFPSPATPMSPPMSPVDPTLIAALDANDIGKATATGAFNKPAGPYSDEQYAKRQLQLQQDREPSQSPRVLSSAGTSGTNDLTVAREGQGSPTSQMSSSSWHSTQAQRQTSIREQSSFSQLRDSNTPNSTQQANNGVFLANTSGSEYGSEPNSPHGFSKQIMAKAAFAGTLDPALRHRKYEHDDQHPAFSSHVEQSEEIPSSETSPDLPLQSEDILLPLPVGTVNKPVNDIINQGGLIDLVRGHLRNISNQSSIYPDSPPRSSHGDGPESLAGAKHEHSSTTEAEPTADSLAARARLLLENATQLRYVSTKPHDVLGGIGIDKAQQVLGGEAPRRSNDGTKMPELPWQEHFKNHNRQGSTETQREREEFANELADRRKQLQDSLRNLVSDDAPSLSRRVNEYSPQRNRPAGFLGATGLVNSAPRAENGKSTTAHADAKYRSEHLNKIGAVPIYGTSALNGSSTSASRQNYTHQASEALRRGTEHSSSTKTPANSNGIDYSRPQFESHQLPQEQYHPAGRARKYSPPNPLRRDEPSKFPYQRSASAQGRHSPALRSMQPNGSYFPPSATPNQTSVFHDSPRASPRSPSFSNHIGPSPEHAPFANDAIGRSDSSGSLVLQTGRKGSINKSEISSPTLLSGTSSLATVGLPHGASLNISPDLSNSSAPPLPPINPRRQRQNFFSSSNNRSASNLSSLSTPSSAVTTPTERTPFLGEDPRDMRSQFLDNGDDKPRFRNRLRKSSSAGENMSQRARYQALKDLGRMPESPKVSTINLGMF